jgi:hypothetical protein
MVRASVIMEEAYAKVDRRQSRISNFHQRVFTSSGALAGWMTPPKVARCNVRRLHGWEDNFAESPSIR